MSTGISFPSNILRMINIERGDIPRSRFLIRMIEERYKKKNKEKNNSSDNRLENPSDELRSKY
jgi:hypothetical protein